MDKTQRCERCGRFGARLTRVVGEKKPRTPGENWIAQQQLLDDYTYGSYGTWVYVPEDEGNIPEDHYVFEAYLCPEHKGTHIVLGGKVSRCDECGRKKYGLGNNFGHTCEDCASPFVDDC